MKRAPAFSSSTGSGISKPPEKISFSTSSAVRSAQREHAVLQTYEATAHRFHVIPPKSPFGIYRVFPLYTADI